MSSVRALNAPLPAMLAGGGLVSLAEDFLALLTGPAVDRELQAFADRMQAGAERVAGGALNAADRDDLVSRVDAVLENEEFYEELARLVEAVSSLDPDLIQSLPSTRTVEQSHVVRALGPASLPAMKQIDRYMMELVKLSQLAEVLAPGAQPPPSAAQALGFLSAPGIPASIARALLGGMRSNVFAMVGIAATRTNKPVSRWLGLAVAEEWANELARFLGLLATLPGVSIREDLVPVAARLDSKALDLQGRATVAAYKRFHLAAQASGQSVFPSEG